MVKMKIGISELVSRTSSLLVFSTIQRQYQPKNQQTDADEIKAQDST